MRDLKVNDEKIYLLANPTSLADISRCAITVDYWGRLVVFLVVPKHAFLFANKKDSRATQSSLRSSSRPSSPYLSTNPSPTQSSPCLSCALRRASSMADQLLSTVTHHGSLPETYVRPESERPRLNEVLRDADVPTIDLGSPNLSQTVAQVADACSTYGFFQVHVRLLQPGTKPPAACFDCSLLYTCVCVQVVNHGVPIELMLKMMAVALEFFRLPSEEKAKLYSDDPAKKMRLSTSFNIRKEKVRNWRDYLRLHCYPLEEFVPGWPSNPSSFK
ncbi:hypothetical protein GW17_00018417 [Ensete ventricosum]|nr:hypothetical protein GW17_00018417 [Ensete ventricosum]